MSETTTTAAAENAAVAASSAPPGEQGKPLMSHRQILFVIFGLMAGMFLSALDQTIVGTAIRTIGDDLNGLSMQAWVTTAYLIVSTIATPIYGKLSDIFGRRPLFLFAIAVFILGSILATFSTSMTELAVFRAVQGLGAGGLMSMPLAIMGDVLAPRERAKYQGYFLAVFGISSVVGPLVGGLFAGADQILWIAGWRWVFLINLPIGVIALAVVLRFLHLPKMPRHSVRIDWWGAAAVIVALVPLLLVAEQGREWGWTEPISLVCYVVGGIGVIAFVLVELWMKDDALIPLKLFHSSTFSMATVIGVLVGFGMFGAMMTIPLYLQLVLGATPTESGFQMLPMILGLMIASIVSGQVIARTGRYRMFPILGTALLAGGFFWLTNLHYDGSYWFMAGAMLCVGLGLGQLMQTLTIASQNSVGLRDMGVATSASTFFRQIGGTLGTAVLISLLFTLLPQNITSSFADQDDLTAALDAALDPDVAGASENAAIMEQIYTPIVTSLEDATTDQITSALSDAEDAAKKAVQEKVDAGDIPEAAQAQAEEQAVGEARAAVVAKLGESIPVATIADDDTVSYDFSDADDRTAFVDSVASKLADTFADSDSSDSDVGSDAVDDTSFLNGADARLTKPILQAFNGSVVSVYWIALFVVILAFILTLFFRTPPLRAKSALQEAADASAESAAESEFDAQRAADTAGVPIGPGSGPIRVPVPASEERHAPEGDFETTLAAEERDAAADADARPDGPSDSSGPSAPFAPVSATGAPVSAFSAVGRGETALTEDDGAAPQEDAAPEGVPGEAARAHDAVPVDGAAEPDGADAAAAGADGDRGSAPAVEPASEPAASDSATSAETSSGEPVPGDEPASADEAGVSATDDEPRSTAEHPLTRRELRALREAAAREDGE